MTRIIEHKLRSIEDNGNTILHNERAFMECLYVDPSVNRIETDGDKEWIDQYNHWAKLYELPKLNNVHVNIVHDQRTKTWFIDKEWMDINLKEWLSNQCKSDEARERVFEEYELFNQHGLTFLLRFLCQLVDCMRKNNIVWGVGRGSSVSSYILFLIGVHHVDSLQYNLDYKEFFK